MTFLDIFIVLLILFTILCLYFLIRNNKVCEFRISIGNKIYNNFLILIEDSVEEAGKYYTSACKEVCNKYTYDQMLYSFKPLKLKYWFTEEEIKLLKL